ncbi:zinc transporter ZupT, partial [Eubacteriales bacterium OttesenSCG-928-N13]|nr:zinc transporter ZupT [Eubacteriales bacterium OttesenSCG-928-N13]
MDVRAWQALLLALLAGLSTLLGAVITLFTRGKNLRLISISLGFAAGIMISVSTIDLYPTALALFQQSMGERQAVLLSVAFLALGIVVAFLLDMLVPHDPYDAGTGAAPHKDLFRVGLVSMLAIGLHNFPEGIATFMAGYEDLTMGISIAIAIALHNIPEGISVAMPVYFATGSRKKAFLYTLYSGIAEPIGALLAFLVLRPFVNSTVLAAVFSGISGIMIYISIEELIPSSRQYGHNRSALIAT